MTVDAYIEKVFDAAWKLEKSKGLPRLATIAQSALENGWGESIPGNMYFGIKAGSTWTGRKQLLTTTEYLNGKYIQIKDWFRAYLNAAESFLDYGNFITSNKRYKPALGESDPRQYVAKIKAAGYATDPYYTNKINTIIDKIQNNATYKRLNAERKSMKTIDILIIAAFILLGISIFYKIIKG